MYHFEEAYEGWQEKMFTQEEAARLLGVSDRTFRRGLQSDELTIFHGPRKLAIF